MGHILFLTALIALQPVSSQNGQFTGMVDYTGAHELKTLSFTLYCDDAQLYRIDDPAAITFFVSDYGTVFACNEQRLYFQDLTGTSRALSDLDHPNGFSFSADNSFFFASDKKGIHVFSAQGHPVSDLLPCRLFAVNRDNSLVASISTDTLYVQDLQTGDLQNRIILKTPFARTVSFCDDRTVSIDETSTVERIDCLSDGQEQ